MSIIIKEWNKDRQLEQIGVPVNTGGFVLNENGVQAESIVYKPTTDYIIWEIEGSNRMTHTSIAELTQSNISIQKIIEEQPERAEEYQNYLDENNEIISLIRNM